MKYKLSSDYVVRNVIDECLLVRVENANEKSNAFYALNPSGKMIIDGINSGKTEEEIVDDFCVTFDVDKATAENDINEFISNFTKLDIIIPA